MTLKEPGGWLNPCGWLDNYIYYRADGVSLEEIWDCWQQEKAYRATDDGNGMGEEF